MADVTVKELAETVKVPVERLLKQLQEAGLPHKSEDEVVTEEQKQVFLRHLQRSHGEKEEPKKKEVKKKDWDEAHVRRILRAFAYGGQASDNQIQIWANMSASDAVQQMLSFDTTNPRLSPPEDLNETYCGSLDELQDF